MASVFAKRGYKGPYVEQAQKKLNSLPPHSGLEPDGDFGARTEGAVMAFQSSKGLMADGVIGAFTDAVLFGKPFEKLKRRPPAVSQNNGKTCWAAATASWLQTRVDRKNYSMAQIIEGMQQEKAADGEGGLRIPSGQQVWELLLGLRPVRQSPGKFYAESALARLNMCGPLMVGYKPASGHVGHVEVMWGTTIHREGPAIVTMDPLGTHSSYKVIRIEEIHGMTGKITTWFPTTPLIL